MKSTLVIIAVFVLFTLISCSPAKQDSGQTQQLPALPEKQEQPAPARTKPVQPAKAETAKQSSSVQNNAEVMLNPPHGQPNHRCDIAVGAPLNSPPANATPQATKQNNAEVMLNPPHGQPNHRCDIAVGAPLSTPQASATRQPTDSQVQSAAQGISNNPTAPTVENAQQQNSSQKGKTATPAKGTKPLNNPPHGQPWHRCDIAVGSPLP